MSSFCLKTKISIALGADNITEGISNNTIQPLRSALTEATGDALTADLIHAGVNVTSSAVAALRQVPKTGLIGMGESSTQATIVNASKLEIGIEVFTTSTTVGGIGGN